MSVIGRMRRQVCTYFAPGPKNNFGKSTWLEPIQIKCRWEDVREEYLDANGERHVSNSKVYVDRELNIDGVLCKSALADITDTANPYKNEGAYKIMKVGELPNFKATEMLREIML